MVKMCYLCLVMKYIVRALKYYVKMAVLLALLLFVLSMFKIIDGNPETMFVNGKDSLWQIALLLLAFSAVYPRFSYCSRRLHMPGSDEEIIPKVKQEMTSRGYTLESEEGGNMTFRLESLAGKISRSWEDRITLTREMNGFAIEGTTKDVIRIINAFYDPEAKDA